MIRGGEGPKTLDRLFRLSASRGKEAAGLAIASGDSLMVFKQPIGAPAMIRMPAFRAFVGAELRREGRDATLAFIGHSRLQTDGAREVNRNNQPVATAGIVGIHNGIIVNRNALWSAHADLQSELEIDSEVIFALMRAQLDRGVALPEAVAKTYAELQGAAAIAALLIDRDKLVLATNNGSLYYRSSPDSFVFTSENFILRTFLEHSSAGESLGRGDGVAVRPGEGVLVDLATLEVTPFRFADPATGADVVRARPRVIEDRSPAVAAPRRSARGPADLEALAARFPYFSTTQRLRRCTRCVLPDSMPLVELDADGVCSICRNYEPIRYQGLDALEALVGPHRRTGGAHDCVIGVSGGRDSLYGLHYVKTVLGLNPIAFTYDWGMVTDLARRNVSRICGKLGIEHVLVSADIDLKRSYVRKNVEAWLQRPSLGIIPLWMAGDKAYFHHLNVVRKQTGIELGILCENLYERTDFKTGFAGLAPQVVDHERVYGLRATAKAKLAGYYLGQFLRNPAYLNRSLVDTALAFVYYYVMDRSYANLYGYVPWEEKLVERTLIDEYDFELSPDTTSTWRIGDGTAAFYNYIYHTVAGFSEHDTMRSNQIRAGVVTREQALEWIEQENRPRFLSIKWYLDALRTDRSIEDVVATINRIPKQYKLRPAVAAQPRDLQGHVESA